MSKPFKILVVATFLISVLGLFLPVQKSVSKQISSAQLEKVMFPESSHTS
jgi:hypothetical protein